MIFKLLLPMEGQSLYLSIVIPVYNVESYLKDCIESLLQQIEQLEEAIEVLLIDDGSTDRSGIICDEYSSQYPDVIKTYHNTNIGLLRTRRFGFLMARGEYILNCDSDDLSNSTQINTLLIAIKKYKADVYLFNMEVFDSKGSCF